MVFPTLLLLLLLLLLLPVIHQELNNAAESWYEYDYISIISIISIQVIILLPSG